MTSSLAAQLANIGTVDRERLQAATSKFRPSFLFPPRQAASLSNEDIHSLAYNGYLALLAQDNRFERFENPIFGEKAKLTDRTILTKEENAKLDGVLEGLLRLLASRFLLKSAGKVLEWLIRRFRVNEFNVEELVRAILPYHETAQFVQMLQIIKLDKHAKFKALEAVKISLQPMPRHHLLTAMSKSHDLFLFVATTVEPYRVQECLYSTLTAFWAGSILAYIEKIKALQPQDMTVLLPVIMQGIKSDNRDLRLGNYIILSHMATRTNLSQETASLLAETILASIRTLSDSEDQEAALTTLAILCSHQDPPLPPFSPKVAAIPLGSLHLLVNIAEKSDITALLQPLLSTILQIAQDQPTLSEQLYQLVAPPSCPMQVTQVVARIILDIGMTKKAIPSTYAKFLSAIEQRLPEGVSLLSFASDPQNSRLVHLLHKMGDSNLGADRTANPGSNVKHRDASLRAAKLQEEIQKHNEDISASVWLEALSDPSLEVASVLFEGKHKSRLAQLCAARPEAVFERCVPASSTDLDSSVVLLRAAFLLDIFSEAVADDWKARVITQFLWPHLLATKRTIQKAAGIWKLIVGLDKAKWPIFKKASQSIKLDTEEAATAFNNNLVNMLSELDGGEAAGHTGFTKFLTVTGLRHQAGENSKTSTLSQLVILRLLSKGDYKYASVVLNNLPSESTTAPIHSFYGVSQLPAAIARRIWNKQASLKTQNMLEGAIFGTAMQTVAAFRPQASWSWLSAACDLDEKTKQHRALVARVYELAHSSKLSTDCRRVALQDLLTKQLRIDVLAFLASLYTSDRADGLRLTALNDTAAFVTQHRDLDCQVLLPSLVAVLFTSKPLICQGVLRIFRIMLEAATTTESAALYGSENFYGTSSAKARFLDKPQYCSLLGAIVHDEASLLIDGSYIQQALLGAAKDRESTENIIARQTLIAFFTSHAEAWRSISARIGLLSSIQRLLDDKRTALFQPFLAEISDSDHAMLSDDEVKDRTYWKLVFRGLGTRTPSDELTQILVNALKGHRLDALAITLRDEVRHSIQTWFLPSATSQQRTEIFTTIMVLVIDSTTNETVRNLEVLRSCLCYSDILQTALAVLRDSLANNSGDGQSTKRVKPTLAASRDFELVRLGLILENLNIKTMTADTGLLDTILGLLAGLVDMSSSQTDLDYYVQLVTTRASELVAALPALEEEVDLRVGPVLETIRVSSNPATSNAALNLMADLARLVPAQVAQNVMPIFTFMGTNILQRDDAQSTRIVDKTIGTIVPALIEQRRRGSSSNEQLISGMEEVLRVFVDAATHVPRHRRLHLFIRFVDILGPADFLAPVCTLMVDKVALKYIKTREQSLLALPLGVYQHFSGSIQLTAVRQQLLDLYKKANVLNSDVVDGSLSSRHSSPATPAESPLLPIKSSRRTLLALLSFLQEVVTSKKFSTELQRVRHATAEALEASFADIAHACIHFMCMEPIKLTQADLTQLSNGSKSLMKSLAHVMTTTEFAKTVSLLIGNASAEVSDLGVDLLAERLSNAKQHHRQVLGPALHTSLVQLSTIVAKSDSKAKRLHALLRIRGLAAYCVDAEAAQLYQTLVSVLEQAEKSTSATFNLQALLLASQAVTILGGRLIPAVHRLLALSSSLIRHHLRESGAAASRNIVTTAFSVLELLLQSVPTFVAKDIKTVLDLCVSVESSVAGSSEVVASLKAISNKVISTATKKLPPQALYQALQELYSTKIAAAAPSVASVITILAQTIRQTSTRVVAESHKSLFSQILLVFDCRSRTDIGTKVVDDVEKAAIGAFMQLALKLNEATFQPLFLRLIDWTTSGEIADAALSSTARKYTFFRVLDRLLIQLKAIAIPYYGLALDAVIQALHGNIDEKLWSLVLSSLRRALEADSGSFWTEARMAKLARPVAEQCRRTFLDRSHPRELYQAVIKAFANAATAHFNVLQDFHRALLHLAKEDDQAIQLASLRGLQAMWTSDAQPDLIACKPESMPTIAELLEIGGQVEQETKALLSTMAEGEEDAEMAMDDVETDSQDGDDSD